MTNEQNKQPIQDLRNIEMFHIPETLETMHMPKEQLDKELGSRATQIMIEVPEGMKASVIPVRHEQPELIESSPWHTDSEVDDSSTSDSDGEYHGGDIEQIAARSGVDVDVVRQAAAESVRRQNELDE